MYQIETKNNCLMVSFKGDFNYSVLKQVIYKELVIPGFCQMNDIWMVGKHRAQIRLGEIQSLVDDFSDLLPPDACDKKVAIVAEPGLTSAIMELLASGLDKRLPISCRIFRNLEGAAEWVGTSLNRVA